MLFLTFNFVEAVYVLDEAEGSAPFNCLCEGLGNVGRELMWQQRPIPLAPPFEDPVQFPDVHGEEADGFQVAGLFEPPVYRLRYV